MTAQQADHDFGRLLRPRISIGMLLRRQMFVRSRPCADESGSQQRFPHGIHQTESDRFNKAVGIVERTQRGAVQVPLLMPKLVEFLVSHKVASAISFWLEAIVAEALPVARS
jgi:hypothetical protein